ncbi:Os06g0287700, partial [Oryza sativa Japonica Group]
CLKELVYTWLVQHYVLVIFYIVADLSHSAGVKFLLSLLLPAVYFPFRKEY